MDRYKERTGHDEVSGRCGHRQLSWNRPGNLPAAMLKPEECRNEAWDTELENEIA